MASIIKRKKNYSVVYNYVDENGETKQKWETWHTHKEALKRKAEIENQQHTGTFLPPSNQTITEFLYDFVSLYGEKKWGVSMYDSQTALIANYINPIIGDMEVQAVTPRAVAVLQTEEIRQILRCGNGRSAEAADNLEYLKAKLCGHAVGAGADQLPNLVDKDGFAFSAVGLYLIPHIIQCDEHAHRKQLADRKSVV